MEKERALELVEGLGGDEHAWVDFKEDYFIKGSLYLEAEFVKDVQALANALVDQDERYLLIGCSEEDGIVGVPDDATDKDAETRHILSFEEDDLQEIIDARLSPGPRISLHTFDYDEESFAVLVVRKVEKPPCITTSKLEDVEEGNTELRENEVWLRKASGKKEVDRDEMEAIIEWRMAQERDSILRGIRRVVELDPDTISTIGNLQPNEEAEADITFRVDDEGDYTVSSTVLRGGFNSVLDELNADISKRRQNSQYYIQRQDLMRYYAKAQELPTDSEAIQLLTESSLDNWIPGIFWLDRLEEVDPLELLRDVPDKHSVRHTVCKPLILAGDQETFEDYLENSESINHPRFNEENYRGLFEKPVEERVSSIFSLVNKVEHDGWMLELDPSSTDYDEIREWIPEVAEVWIDCQDKDLRTDLKYAVGNLELVLAKDVFSGGE